MDYARIASKLREKIVQFWGELSFGYPKVVRRFLAEMNYGIQARQSMRLTEVSRVCGPDNTLHLVYRLWRYGEPPYPNSHRATLAYSRKRPGQPWEAPRVLVVPPVSSRYRAEGIELILAVLG